MANLTVAQPSVLRRVRAGLGWNAIVAIELAVILAVWQYAVYGAKIWNPNFVPAPSDIGAAFVQLFTAGSLLRNAPYSLQNFVVGYLVAVGLGVPIGLLLGSFRRFRQAFMPFFWLAFVMPRLAFQPLLVIWFGFGSGPKMLIIFLMAFFPIVVIVYEGVKGIDPHLLRAGRVFGAGRMQLYREIILPGALPFVLTALRIGIARALVGVVIGEFIGGNEGLGFLVQRSAQNFRVADGLAIALVLIILANGSMVLLNAIKQRLAPWDLSEQRAS